MRFFIVKASVSLLVLGGLAVSSPVLASGDLTFDVEVRGSYEDNVAGGSTARDKRTGTKGGTSGVGMMSALDLKGAGGQGGMGGGSGAGSSQGASGDFSTFASASIGGYLGINGRSSVTVRAFGDHTAFARYSEYDMSTAGLTAGYRYSFGEILSARLQVTGKFKDYALADQDSRSLAAGVSLKQQGSDRFWLQERYDHEINDANSSGYSYLGDTFGVNAGYQLVDELLFTLGYSYSKRGNRDPASTGSTTNTWSGGVEHDFAERWSVDVAYDRQSTETEGVSGAVNDNVFSAGIRYSY